MKVRDSDQAKHLKTVIWKDQHGRPWDLTLDKDTLTHTTPPIPRFRAPLAVPLEYVKTDEDKIGRVRIDYRAWEAEWTAAEAQWRDRRRELGRVVKDSDDLAALVGTMPQSPEFVRAARAGNRWVLGLPHPVPGKRYAVPEALEPLVAAGRLGPRATRASDFAEVRKLERAKYADREESVDAVEEMEDEILPPLDAHAEADDPDFDVEDGPEFDDEEPDEDDLDEIDPDTNGDGVIDDDEESAAMHRQALVEFDRALGATATATKPKGRRGGRRNRGG